MDSSLPQNLKCVDIYLWFIQPFSSENLMLYPLNPGRRQCHHVFHHPSLKGLKLLLGTFKNSLQIFSLSFIQSFIQKPFMYLVFTVFFEYPLYDRQQIMFWRILFGVVGIFIAKSLGTSIPYQEENTKAKAERSTEQKSEEGKYFFLIKVCWIYNMTFVSNIQLSVFCRFYSQLVLLFQCLIVWVL